MLSTYFLPPRAGSFALLLIARYVDVPSVLYLQEPYRRFYEALPVPPWAADERGPGWWDLPEMCAKQ